MFKPIELSVLKTRGPKGFTLIELLVVIAIISLLVSILLPSLNRAKELGKSLKCLTNLRHIGVAAILYTEDFEGFFFPHYDYRDRDNNGILDGPPWFYDGPTLGLHYTPFFGRQYLGPDVFIGPSRGEGSVYHCPLWDGRSGWVTTIEFNNYGYNMAVGPNFTYFPAVNIASIERPSDLVEFADAADYVISPNPDYWSYWDDIYGVRDHPDGRFNAVFVDAHAATFRQRDLDDSNFNL